MDNEGSSRGSPDPLALSFDRDPGDSEERVPSSPMKMAALRETSPNRSTPTRPQTTPTRRRPQRPAETPMKQTQEMIIHTPGPNENRSAGATSGADGNSPWRFRVTVEAERAEENRASSRRRTTVKVPLNDAEGKTTAAKGTPRKRGRPKKSEASEEGNDVVENSDLVVKRLRRNLPARQGRRQSGLVNEILHSEIDGARDDVEEQPISQAHVNEQPKRRGRPKRKTETRLTPVENGPVDSTRHKSTPKKKSQPFRDSIPIPSRTVDEQKHIEEQEDEIPQERSPRTVSEEVPTSEPLLDMDQTSDMNETSDDIQMVSLGETTAELDRSAIESEGFSIVSLESLRSQKEKAEQQARMRLAIAPQRRSTAKPTSVSYPTLPRSSPQPTTTISQRQQPSMSASREDTQGSHQIARENAQGNAGRPSRPDIFNAYGDVTQRELRGSLLAGEHLARDKAARLKDTAEPKTNAPTRRAQNPSPQKAAEFGRLPTPADSVTSNAKAAGGLSGSDPVQPSRSNDGLFPSTAHQARESEGRDTEGPADHYDEMSWRPESVHSAYQPSQVIGVRPPGPALPPSTLSDSDIWRDEADRSLEDHANPRRARQRPAHRTEENAVAQEKLSAQLLSPEPLPVKRLVPSQPDESSDQPNKRTKITPFDKRQRNSPAPSISELLPPNDKLAHGKIPRTWRRTSSSDFLYSDETGESPQVQNSRKPAFHSPGEPISMPAPTIFQRLGIGRNADTTPTQEQSMAEKPIEDDSLVQENTTGELDGDHAQTVNFSPGLPSRKSILSSPERRPASPSKSVQWHNDDSLVETRGNSSVLSIHSSANDGATSSPPRPTHEVYDEDDTDTGEEATSSSDRRSERAHDGFDMVRPDDDDTVTESGEEADVDTFFSPPPAAAAPQSNNDPEPSTVDVENYNTDDTFLASSPLNVKSSKALGSRKSTFSTASTVTDLPSDSASSDEDDIPALAQGMSHSAARARPYLPDTSKQTAASAQTQGLLRRISSFFFPPSITTPIRPSDPSLPRPGPHLWTRQHQSLTVRLFEHLPTLHRTTPFRFNTTTKTYELNYVHPPPANADPLPPAFFLRADDLPPVFAAEIGKTYRTIPRCNRGAVCGPRCPGVPRPCRWRVYSRTITESDVRLAYAVAAVLRDDGLVVYDGEPWQRTSERTALRDEHGETLVRREIWDDARGAKIVCWRVFGCWVNRGMKITVQRAGSGSVFGEMCEGDGWGARLWREREAFGL